MPTVAEKARAEADQVEAEEQEQQQDQQDPSNGDEEQEAPLEHDPAEGLEEPSEQMIEELRAANMDHFDHVRSIMGGFVKEFEPCEVCNGIGLAYPTPQKPHLEPAPGLALCSVCKGPGELETPSTRSGFDVIQCVNCGGKGYVGTLAGVSHEVQQAVETYPQGAEGAQATTAPLTPPSSTDPRVEELRAAGYIVLEKPGA